MPFDGTGFKPVVLDEDTLLLITARELVVQGWCQGSLMEADRVCAIGALRLGYCLHAMMDPLVVGQATSRLARAAYGSDDPSGIVPWNDAPGRTKDDVLRVYDVAIAAA